MDPEQPHKILQSLKRNPQRVGLGLVALAVAGVIAMWATGFFGELGRRAAEPSVSSAPPGLLFQPFAPELRTGVVSSLSSIDAGQPLTSVTVVVYYQLGSSARARVAGQLAAVFADAGFTSEAADRMRLGGGSEPIGLRFNPLDRSLAAEIANAVQPLIGVPLRGAAQDTLDRGRIMLDLDGDPVFLSEGVVAFR